MFALRTVRSQMYFGVITLLVIVVIASAVGVHGARKFRHLTKSIRQRSMELPQAAELGQQVSQLRSLLWQLTHQPPSQFAINQVDRSHFTGQLQEVGSALERYRQELVNSQTLDSVDGDSTQEMEFVVDFRRRLERIACIIDEEEPTDWVWSQNKIYDPLETELSELQGLAAEIPIFMQRRMDAFAAKARTEYHAWMSFALLTGLAAVGLIAYLIHRFRARIIRPLEIMLNGSRQVAGGNYSHRIEMDSQDEVAELAGALNSMTENFQSIQSDLNQQVRQRTKEVVRSEKMASVGFLAAGVAHEINNPMATIAWSAESLESRLEDILAPLAANASEACQAEIDDMKTYLRRIQDEAFRIKGITDGLLNFARMGDVRKVHTGLTEIVQSVIEIVKPLGKYRRRNIRFQADENITAVVNEQEMKQVVLNLITNALASVEENGTVDIQLRSVGGQAVLTITDDGCGMDEEVRKHLFEPFFTRRRDGQGTGLGLSITHQIIEDHGGRITAESEGIGRGSTFQVFLPQGSHEQKLARSA